MNIDQKALEGMNKKQIVDTYFRGNADRKGYSTLKKTELITWLTTGSKPAPEKGSVAWMKAQCKSKGIKGYSYCTKSQLEQVLKTGVVPPRTFKVGTVAYMRELLKKHNVSGRSKAKDRTAVECLLAENKIAHDEPLSNVVTQAA